MKPMPELSEAANWSKIPDHLSFLAIRNFEKGGRTVREWVAARNQLAIMFAGRFDA